MTEPDLQRWTHQVAEDPGAPSFVPLARAYRRQGRPDAARDVVLRGLEANPEHVDGHALLALIHVESGERQKARDEWETVLRLDPGNFDASRGLGFLALERGDLGAARRHLDTAATTRPDDPAVREARRVLERRSRGPARGNEGPAGASAARHAASTDAGAAPAGPADAAAAPSASAGGPDAAGASGAASGSGSEPAPGGAPEALRDPARLFASLTSDSPFRGALVLDARGLVLAGRLEGDGDQADLLGALLNSGLGEAQRAAEILGLGPWRGLVLESGEATVHVTALAEDAAVVLIADRDAPAGWVVRTADRASRLAARFLEESP